MKEAELVADYILHGGDKNEFTKYFGKATSEGFDPDKVLKRLGLANQTTMYKREYSGNRSTVSKDHDEKNTDQLNPSRAYGIQHNLQCHTGETGCSS
mmetsp:Transcript_29243/g.41391  ORF Transcript_29243/g.41391 Transcript_29243/m.41391 type:complete len:97 (+) Transcript_29243:429-719(+)